MITRAIALGGRAEHAPPLHYSADPTASPSPSIVVGVDFSPASHAALAWALRHGIPSHASLHLVHVSQGPESPLAARMRADSDARLACDSALVELERLTPEEKNNLGPLARHVRHGHPLREILTCVRELHADLLVVGSHGSTGLQRLLVGSVAEQIARLSECPVVIVKEPRSAVAH